MKRLLHICLLALSAVTATAREKEKHGTWYWDYKKLEGSEYEIVFHVNLEERWYVCAEDDNKKSLQPPVFNFNDSGENFSYNGVIVPKGIMLTRIIKHRGLVNIYSYNALYSQRVFARPNTKITGSFVYQLFTERKIKREQREDFEVTLQ